MAEGQSLKVMEKHAVLKAYANWAPCYDKTFGLIVRRARLETQAVLNGLEGRLLEIGVGTGIALSDYGSHLRIVGIDLSPDMLERAQRRVDEERLGHIEMLREMDASNLDFAASSFDLVTAHFVLTTVPDPLLVFAEMIRVCRPGGHIVITNHFSTEVGLRGWIERRLSPLSSRLGWRPEFPLEPWLSHVELDLVEKRVLRPFGLFTLLHFKKKA